ncbi:hypothetical protein LPJ55_003981 [Coemansia sp. RSA 990]|nr:hypothetical protein LPJ55_003981 [Coemansia sp. RSA 990]
MSPSPENKPDYLKIGEIILLVTARAALFAAYSILAACTAMLDPMVPIALASSDNNSIIVKGVSIACMSLAAVFMIYTIVHVSRKR